MVTLTTRAGKGASLSHAEMDVNLRRAVSQKIASYTLIESDNRDLIECNSASPITMTLGTADTMDNADTGDYEVSIVNIGTGDCTVASDGTDTIDGSTSSIVLAQYESITLKVVSDSSGYVSVGGGGLLGVTASADELNIMDGVTASTEELNTTDGVTSAIQPQLDAQAAVDTSQQGQIDAIVVVNDDQQVNLGSLAVVDANQQVVINDLVIADASQDLAINNLVNVNTSQQVAIDALVVEDADQQGQIDILDLSNTSQQVEINTLAGVDTSQQTQLDALVVVDTSQQNQINAKANSGVNSDITRLLGITSSAEVANLNVEQHGGLLVTRVTIPPWNMDSTPAITVIHGIAPAKVVSFSVHISDDGGELRDLNYQNAGSSVALAFSSNISLNRVNAGFFDSVDYNGIFLPRGHIVVWHLP